LNWIEQIVMALLRWLTGLAREDKTSQDAKPQPELKKRLLDRIDAHEQRVRDAGDSGAKR
jgi:hypothetical protein